MPARKGMWVKFGEQLGILVSFDSGGTEVHLVNAAGETVQVVQPQMAELRQATYAEIPKARRPSKVLAAKLGYQ